MSAQSAIFNPSQTTSAASGDGFSVPRLTTTGRLAISFGTADKGMMVYDTTLNNLFIWNGSAWESVPASGDAGADGSVQYNDNGVVSGAANLQYNKASGFTSLRSGSALRAYVADNSVYSTISDLGAAGGLTIDNLNADGISLRIGGTNVLNVSAGSATITGNLTVDTNTLFVDSTNDNVGIGTTTPASYAFNDPVKLAIANTGTAGAGNTFTIASGSTGFGNLAFANGTSGTARYNGYIAYNHSSNFMAFYTNAGVERARFNSSGAFVLAGGTTTANGIGVAFPATQSASSDANCLDDYEEGTWTATVRGTVTDPTVPLTATCRYTKIGRQVFVEGVISGDTTGASGLVFISSLPFTPAAGIIERPGSVQMSNMATFTGYATSYIAGGTANINFYASPSGAALGNVTHNPGASRTIWFGITYTT